MARHIYICFTGKCSLKTYGYVEKDFFSLVWRLFHTLKIQIMWKQKKRHLLNSKKRGVFQEQCHDFLCTKYVLWTGYQLQISKIKKQNWSQNVTCLYPEAQHNMLKSIHGKFYSCRTWEYFWSNVQHKSKTAFFH